MDLGLVVRACDRSARLWVRVRDTRVTRLFKRHLAGVRVADKHDHLPATKVDRLLRDGVT